MQAGLHRQQRRQDFQLRTSNRRLRLRRPKLRRSLRSGLVRLERKFLEIGIVLEGLEGARNLVGRSENLGGAQGGWVFATESERDWGRLFFQLIVV